MEANREIVSSAPAARSFREADDEGARQDDCSIEEVRLSTGLPLEVNMTDEPGGDPYNHTGRFRRNFR
jgi:hypothetical protein